MLSPFIAHRLMRNTVLRLPLRISLVALSGSLMLIGLLLASYAQAIPLQNDKQASIAIEQPMHMTACLPCASCYVAPPSVANITGSGDQPALASAGMWTRFAVHITSDVIVSGASAPPSILLRLMYCRWLN